MVARAAADFLVLDEAGIAYSSVSFHWQGQRRTRTAHLGAEAVQLVEAELKRCIT